MELKKILMGLEGLKAKGNLDLDIKNIQNNSKKVKKDDMFIAIRGFTADGHDYVEDAVQNGATVIMLEEGFDFKKIKLPEDITIIVTKDTRYATRCMFL